MPQGECFKLQSLKNKQTRNSVEDVLESLSEKCLPGCRTTALKENAHIENSLSNFNKEKTSIQ